MEEEKMEKEMMDGEGIRGRGNGQERRERNEKRSERGKEGKVNW